MQSTESKFFNSHESSLMNCYFEKIEDEVTAATELMGGYKYPQSADICVEQMDIALSLHILKNMRDKSCTQLYETSLDYFVRNFDEIVLTETWRVLKNDNPVRCCLILHDARSIELGNGRRPLGMEYVIREFPFPSEVLSDLEDQLESEMWFSCSPIPENEESCVLDGGQGSVDGFTGVLDPRYEEADDYDDYCADDEDELSDYLFDG